MSKQKLSGKGLVIQFTADELRTLTGYAEKGIRELREAQREALGERAALNTPIQGTAADVMKLAMLRVWRALREQRLRGRLLLQIHDELIVECPEEEAEAVSALLCREMKAAADLPVPLLAEAGVGRTWYEAKS